MASEMDVQGSRASIGLAVGSLQRDSRKRLLQLPNLHRSHSMDRICPVDRLDVHALTLGTASPPPSPNTRMTCSRTSIVGLRPTVTTPKLEENDFPGVGGDSLSLPRHSRGSRTDVSSLCSFPTGMASPSEAKPTETTAAAAAFVPKIVVLGAEGTGKSTIVNRWLRGRSPLEPAPYEPTIEDRFQHKAVINGREQTVEVIDTSGADDMADMRMMSIRAAHAFLLVYAVDSAASLAALRRIKTEIFEALGCSMSSSRSRKLRFPMVLVGNKVDLVGLPERQVSVLDGATFAKDFFHCKFLEVSGRSGANVDEAFARLMKKLGDSIGSLSKALSLPAVARSHSFLGRTIAAVRPKRRPKLLLTRSSGSSSSLTLPAPASPLAAAVADTKSKDVNPRKTAVSHEEGDRSHSGILAGATVSSC